MIDSHCHLEMVAQKTDLGEAIKNFRDLGGRALLTISTDLESLDFLAEDLSDKFQFPIFKSSGIHPHEAKIWSEDIKKRIINLAKSKNCIAIGEIGYDFYYDTSPRDLQSVCFRDQIQIAKDLNLPIIIHTRDAESETFTDMIASSYPRFLIHCFTGTLDFAKKCWESGYFTSFSGIITFKNALDIQEVVKNCPLDSFLIETDAPFLSPIPFRGRPNQPSRVLHIAEAIAHIKQISVQEVIELSTKNFEKFFQVKV